MVITMNNPCEWCNNTSGKVDSQEAHIEELKELIERQRKELSNRSWINDNLNKQLVKRLIKKSKVSENV